MLVEENRRPFAEKSYFPTKSSSLSLFFIPKKDVGDILKMLSSLPPVQDNQFFE